MEDVSEKLRLLRQHEWQPGDGDYLGILHYRYAEEKLGQNFRVSMTGNDYRRGKSLSLCRHMQTILLKNVPQHLMQGEGVLDLDENIYDEEAVTTVDEDHLKQITRFLSHYARACRWEVRQPGTLKKIKERALRNLETESDFDLVLGYLLILGKDIFLFYLLLWEAAFKTDVDNKEGGIHV
jgi:hypothetical protein